MCKNNYFCFDICVKIGFWIYFSLFIWYSVSDRIEVYIYVYLDLVYFFFIEFIKLVFEVDKCIVNIGVVG